MNNKPIWRTLRLSTLYDQQPYQRVLSTKWVNEKSKEFDEGIVGSLIVNHRKDGVLAVIDGKHRRALLLNKGYKDWMCQVFTGLSYTEEAEKFHLFNGSGSRRSITQYQNFVAMLECQNPSALEIRDMVSKYGFRIGQGGSSDNKIKAISAITGIYLRDVNNFDRILNLLRQTWNGNKDSFDSILLLGMEILIKKAGCYFDDKDFINSLKRIDPISIIRETNSRGRYEKHCAQILLDYYNFKRRTKIIPEDVLITG